VTFRAPRSWLGKTLFTVAALLLSATGALSTRKTRVHFNLVADPCSEVCRVNLCVVQGATIMECPERCPSDLHLALPAKQRVILKLQDPANPRHRLGALVYCFSNTRPCFPCRSDAECDDGNACTTDMCVPAMIGGCQHIDRF